MSLSFDLNDEQKEFLSRQASQAIETVFAGDSNARPSKPPQVPANSVLERNLGSFVTLELAGNLRGCIGTIVAREPLYLNVWNMARAAAFNDPRFPPLTAAEWKRASVEISVLDEPSMCPDVNQIVIGRDGLILTYQGRSGVFLPQVPVEQGWNLQQYLDHLCMKAGVAPGSWKKPGAVIYWYQALVFPANKVSGDDGPARK